MMPWMRPPSKRLLRDQYSIGSTPPSGDDEARAGRRARTKTDTHSSNTIDSAMTHFSADAMARTSSRQVSTLPTKSACSVVMPQQQQRERASLRARPTR